MRYFKELFPSLQLFEELLDLAEFFIKAHAPHQMEAERGQAATFTHTQPPSPQMFSAAAKPYGLQYLFPQNIICFTQYTTLLHYIRASSYTGQKHLGNREDRQEREYALQNTSALMGIYKMHSKSKFGNEIPCHRATVDQKLVSL